MILLFRVDNVTTNEYTINGTINKLQMYELINVTSSEKNLSYTFPYQQSYHMSVYHRKERMYRFKAYPLNRAQDSIILQ